MRDLPTISIDSEPDPRYVQLVKALLVSHAVALYNVLDEGGSVTNGTYCTNTRDAVKRFQRRMGLNQNGVVDNKTWTLLRHKAPSALIGDIRGCHEC